MKKIALNGGYLIIMTGLIFTLPGYAETTEVDMLATVKTNETPEQGIPIAFLDPIIVTARKYEEEMTNIPFSISVLRPEDNKSINATHESAGMANKIANLNLVEPGGTFSNLFMIRGIGSIKPLSADDSAVSIYEDGVPKSTVSAPVSLFDTKRVEVLRGPQGTLFGRNSQGGTINVVSNSPQFDSIYKVGASLGNLQQREVHFVANDVIGDGMGEGGEGAWRLAARYSKKDGDIPNVATKDDAGSEKDYVIRAGLTWLLNEDTELNAKVWSHKRESNNPRYILAQNFDFPKVSLNPEDLSEWHDTGISLEAIKYGSDMTVTSLTSFEQSDTSQSFDFTDGFIFSKIAPLPVAAFNNPAEDFAYMEHEDRRFQQEVRLAGSGSNDSEWQIGANFFTSDFSNTHESNATHKAPMFAAQNGWQTSDIQTKSLAVFGETQVPINDKVDISVGGRVSNEHKDVEYNFVGNGHPAVVAQYAQDDSIEDTLYSGRLGLTTKISPQYTAYANVAHGSTASGFPLYSVNLAKGKPVEAYPVSKNWSYETGLRWQSDTFKSSINTSLFYNDIKDSHLLVFNPKNATLITKVVDYDTYGVEVEGKITITPQWSFKTALGLTQAQLNKVDNASSFDAKKGNDVPNVANLSASTSLNYINSNGWEGQLSWQHISKRSADIANSFDLPAYNIWNAKIGYSKDDWTAYLYGNNLLDKKGYVTGQTWGLTKEVRSVRLNEPRVFGVGFEKQW